MKRTAISLIIVACSATLCVSTAMAQQLSAPKYEFRGVWVASVLNLDWPDRGRPADEQRENMVRMLDALEAAGINAVFFQVRAEADALYESQLEPWSYWLTGEQGTAPEPFFDPLAAMLEETRKRGMELHAWFNPYRAVRGSGYTNASTHVSVEHPEWLLQFGSLAILNPGLQEVRDYITTVIMDVVRRYDVDGVHFDDFFYPYPPNQITNEDVSTFEANSRGFSRIQDWRRDNVNLFVAQVSDSLEVFDPALKFGISPFGIWKNGVPFGIIGLDAANVIYADALDWLDAETVDYIAPQLYWAFGGGQDYALLAPWWADQSNGRHVYTGHGLYRSDPNTFSGTLYSENEVPNQVRFNRREPGVQGSIFFRSKNITTFSSKGFADSLATDLFRRPALPPQMPWKDSAIPEAPVALMYEWQEDDVLRLNWESFSARRFAVYRTRSTEPPDPKQVVQDASNLLVVTGETSVTDRPGIAEEPYYYFVTAVSRNSFESEASNLVSVGGRAVARESEVVYTSTLSQNFPNPFRSQTQIAFTLDQAQTISLVVFNVLGQEVATLAEGVFFEPGKHTIRWDGTNVAGIPVSSGTYLYSLITRDQRLTRSLVRYD